MVLKNVKTLLISFIAFVLLSLSVFGYIQTKRVGLYRERCEYYRVELTTNTVAINECLNSIRRAKEQLGSTSRTLEDLREKLKAVRQEYENMEKLLYGICSDTGRGTDK